MSDHLLCGSLVLKTLNLYRGGKTSRRRQPVADTLTIEEDVTGGEEMSGRGGGRSSPLWEEPPTWLCMNFRLMPSSVTCSRPPSPVFMSWTGNSPPSSGPEGRGIVQMMSTLLPRPQKTLKLS
ncbi:hypothetical protein EYF80_045293 [Liparis tanakae]|uniref:Uncharacterized protein n=1 Tax=Liparis tanakae TaxID=230148 RepID=A0A4Z2FTC9_9TELE|nr:hypothetical protein EYF80_045293 [Liparis tanakae]